MDVKLYRTTQSGLHAWYKTGRLTVLCETKPKRNKSKTKWTQTKRIQKEMKPKWNKTKMKWSQSVTKPKRNETKAKHRQVNMPVGRDVWNVRYSGRTHNWFCHQQKSSKSKTEARGPENSINMHERGCLDSKHKTKIWKMSLYQKKIFVPGKIFWKQNYPR